MIFWMGFLAGLGSGMMMTLFYAAWATRETDAEIYRMSQALNLWRRGWVPRDWHGADRLAKSEAAKPLGDKGGR